MFEQECPSCIKEAKENNERLILSARIKNITDFISMGDLFNQPLDKLQKIDNLLTPIFKEKSNVTNS